MDTKHRAFLKFCTWGLAITFASVNCSVSATEIWKQLPAPKQLPVPTKAGDAKIAGIKIHYSIYGKGQPVIFLHGGMANSEYWGNQVPALMGKYQVVLMDTRGHGKSTNDKTPFSYHHLASDVLALQDYLGLKRTSMVGWSDGAIIGLDIAINHPDRINKLFAFGANYNTAGVRTDCGNNPTLKMSGDMMKVDYARLSKTPKAYDEFNKAVSKMWATEPSFSEQQLKSIKTPTDIVDGEFDEAINRSHTEKLAKLIPGAKLVILPNTSHFAQLQKPDEFNKVLLEFLDYKQQ